MSNSNANPRFVLALSIISCFSVLHYVENNQILNIMYFGMKM